jgi:hypothetical protein
MYEIQLIQQIARKEAKANPKLANDIMESARLALSEIAAGESPAHELELFEDHIEELTN